MSRVCSRRTSSRNRKSSRSSALGAAANGSREPSPNVDPEGGVAFERYHVHRGHEAWMFLLMFTPLPHYPKDAARRAHACVRAKQVPDGSRLPHSGAPGCDKIISVRCGRRPTRSEFAHQATRRAFAMRMTERARCPCRADSARSLRSLCGSGRARLRLRRSRAHQCEEGDLGVAKRSVHRLGGQPHRLPRTPEVRPTAAFSGATRSSNRAPGLARPR